MMLAATRGVEGVQMPQRCEGQAGRHLSETLLGRVRGGGPQRWGILLHILP